MATPTEIADETLDELRATRTMMNSTRWFLELEEQDQATKEKAAIAKINVHHAILKLENAKLTEIRDQLVLNEGALKEGINRMQVARRDLEKVGEVLEVVSGFLVAVGKVVKLLV